MTAIIVKNGQGRPKNPYEEDSIIGVNLQKYMDFEQSVQYHEAPGIPDGEHEGELVWQTKPKVIKAWYTLKTESVDEYKQQFPNHDYRQIWVIKSEK